MLITNQVFGLSDGRTPSEAAGTKIEGSSKRKTVIRAAARAEATI